MPDPGPLVRVENPVDSVSTTVGLVETLLRLLDDFDVITRRVNNARDSGNSAVLVIRRDAIRRDIDRVARALYTEGYAAGATEAFAATATWAHQRAELKELRRRQP